MRHIFAKLPTAHEYHDEPIDRETIYVAVEGDLNIDEMCEAFTRYLKVCGYPMDNREVILIEMDKKDEIISIMEEKEYLGDEEE